MDNLSRFGNPEIFEELDAENIILHIISEDDVNPLDEDMSVNTRKGRYVLLKKKKIDDDDSEYKEIFNTDEADILEGGNENKSQYETHQKKKISEEQVPILSELHYHMNIQENFKSGEIENIKYSNPIRMGTGDGEHVVYQRIILKNTGDETNAYNFIKDSLERNGIELEVIDATFDGKNVKYIASVDGKKENIYGGNKIKYIGSDLDGENNSSWEVIVDGNFLQTAIEKGSVKKNSVVEIRRKSGCGGGTSSDSLTLENDPTINKSFLPSYMQKMNSYSNLSSSAITGYMGRGLGMVA